MRMKSKATILAIGLLSSSSSSVKPFSLFSRRAFVSTAALAATTANNSTTMTGDNKPSDPERTAKAAKFWNRMAQGYSKSKIADETSYQIKLKKTQEYFRPDMEVVEIGCGTGGTSIIHAPYVKHILATDISKNMLEIAKEKAASANVKNVEFREGAVDQLEIPDGSKDVVMAHSILHLLENKEADLARVHRWLKPGGLFVSSTVCIAEMGVATNILIKTLLPIGQFFGVLPKVAAFTKDELKDSIRSAGFTIEHEWQPKDKGSAAFIVGKKPE